MEMDELARRVKLFEDLIVEVDPARLSSTLTQEHWEEEGQWAGLRPPTMREVEFEERGLVLVDRYELIPTENPNVATVGGTCLVLLKGGRLAELERSGSRTCGDEDWTATLRAVSPEEAITRYGFEACVARITK